jgi:hypothetical protein
MRLIIGVIPDNRIYRHPNSYIVDREGGKGVKQPKLNYIFHNPNTAEASAEYLLRLFVESGKPKAEQAILAILVDSCYSLGSNRTIPNETER